MDDLGGPKRGNPNWVKGQTPEGAKPFPKGQSGNPRGGSHRGRLANLLFQQLGEKVEGDPKERTFAELVVRSIIKEAFKGCAPGGNFRKRISSWMSGERRRRSKS